MLLGFKKNFPWNEPTHFKEKVLAGLYPGGVYAETGFVPKIHTIRSDPHERWKPGMSIQFAHGVRTPNLEIWYDSRGQERGGCVSVQKLTIGRRGKLLLYDDDFENLKTLSEAVTLELARNDGFESVDEMIQWFFWESPDEFVSGRLIHWTEKRY